MLGNDGNPIGPALLKPGPIEPLRFKMRTAAMKIQRAQASNDFTGTLDELIDREAAARLLHVSARTLDRWHALGIGPPRRCDALGNSDQS